MAVSQRPGSSIAVASCTIITWLVLFLASCVPADAMSITEFTSWRKNHCLATNGYWGSSVTVSSPLAGFQTVTLSADFRDVAARTPPWWSKQIPVGRTTKSIDNYPDATVSGGTYSGDGGMAPAGNGICVNFDKQLNPLWDDGSSQPWFSYFLSLGSYPRLFYNAGRRHDYCYHHNPVTYGRSKVTCDKGFLGDARSACENKFGTLNPERLVCKLAGYTAYAGLLTTMALSGNAWGKTNVIGYYEDPPLTVEQIVLAEVPLEMRQLVDTDNSAGFVGSKAMEAYITGDLSERGFWRALFVEVEGISGRLASTSDFGAYEVRLYYPNNPTRHAWARNMAGLTGGHVCHFNSGYRPPIAGLYLSNAYYHLSVPAPMGSGNWIDNMGGSWFVDEADPHSSIYGIALQCGSVDFRAEVFRSWDYYKAAQAALAEDEHQLAVRIVSVVAGL